MFAIAILLRDHLISYEATTGATAMIGSVAQIITKKYFDLKKLKDKSSLRK
jgi:hypothetical protein